MESQREHVIELYEKYVNPGRAKLVNLMNLGVEARAEKALVWDDQGNEYIDCLGSFGVFNVGHRHPKVLEAVRRELDRLPVSTRFLVNERLAEFAAMLGELAPGDVHYTFPVHSGAAAVEGALKLVRAASGRTDIVSTKNAFHGKTMGALSASGKPFFKEKFEPLLEGFTHVPYGDDDAVKAAITEKTAAVIVEPIQGEAGIIVPPDGYLQRLRTICDEHDVLLIFDEVQTGLGRTGTMFACEHEGVSPDVMTLSKALGGGVMPLGAFMGTARVWEPLAEDPYLHSTTVESPLAFAAAKATLEILQDEKLPQRSAELGDYFMDALRGLQDDFPAVIADVRGRGLMIGMSFVSDGQGGMLFASLLEKGVLVGFAFNNPQILRFEPPLVITKAQIDHVLSAIKSVLPEVQALTDYQ